MRTCVHRPGYVGVLTGLRPGAFSVSINYRRSEAGNRNMLKGIVTNMVKGLANAWPVSFLVREVLAQDANYERAVASLKLSSLMAPTYIIVAGVNQHEGCVLTRERNGNRTWPTQELSAGPIVQANMDHFRDDDKDGLEWEPGTADREVDWPFSVAHHPSSLSLLTAHYYLYVQATGKPASERQSSHWQDICDSRNRRAVARAVLAQGPASPEDLWALLSMRSGGNITNRVTLNISRATVLTPWTVSHTTMICRPCLAHDTVYTVAMHPASGYLVTRTHATRGEKSAATRKWGGVAAAAQRAVRERFRDDDEFGEEATRQ